MSIQKTSDPGLGCWHDCLSHNWKETQTNQMIKAGLIDQYQAKKLLEHPSDQKKTHIILFARKGPKANVFYAPNVTRVSTTGWFQNQLKNSGNSKHSNKGTIPVTNKLGCFAL